MEITLVESQQRALAPWLIGYVGAETDAGSSPLRRVLPARPNCFIQIILAGDHTMIDIDSGTHLQVPAASLFGPLTHYRFDMAITGRLRTFSARLQPAAAGQLFGIEPVTLVNQFMPIPVPSDLLAGLRQTDDWHAMAARVDHWLLTLMQGQSDGDRVAQAARELRDRRGQCSIQQLADEAGISLRHFQRRFRTLTGLNPKLYARICRVSHAVHRKQLEPGISWTEVALEAGYADQSHFIRDFKALTAVLPQDFLRGQTPILRQPRWED